ncbi:hypothetical protein HLASF_1281 [Halanaeroarchaeum sulfurireducens]|uniref:Uncharacterized protein n=1 Tax=Halanaeroarchaeum sulfurireducens TaxID=1604004 RepID=A0A0F7PAK9_9EURY|nr:hypothetical protein HLASF_1281 [Halanaeroarchaeum sulfurireducens]ALG82162.1 hypothetical protein HLASA_1269 [Halanaeroarchaeum sulfurireducens]
MTGSVAAFVAGGLDRGIRISPRTERIAVRLSAFPADRVGDSWRVAAGIVHVRRYERRPVRFSGREVVFHD